MNREIAVREEVSPEQFDQNIQAAQHKARSLKQIVDSQGLSVRIGTSEHLKVEAWLTIAAGYGYSPRTAWSRPLPGGGYEAHAELVDSLGTVVGAGEAECGTEGDDNWLEKPAFQQRSMAQTRATVRACRNKLAWVVILAGYSPTPAEEMGAGRREATADPRFHCTEHNVEWFKKGKMQRYAHPISDTGQWCNMPKEGTARDAREADMAITPDGWPQSAPPPSAVAQVGELMREAMQKEQVNALPASVAELLTRATNELGYHTRAEMFTVLGIQSATELAHPEKLAWAWATLQEHAPKKAGNA